MQFTCLVPADSVYERIAVALQRQLAAASVDMRVEEVSQDKILEALDNGKFDAVLVDMISGPSLFRSYRHWNSTGETPQPIASAAIDRALDQIRHAPSDDEYRRA